MAGRKRKPRGKGRKGGKTKARGRKKRTDEDKWNKEESSTEDIVEEDLP